jgi:hypothetical protein
MQYQNYETEIVIQHGVQLVGWTNTKWAPPGELSSALPALQQLLTAIETKACKFVKLTEAERKAREAEYSRKVEAGEIVGPVRKVRKDKGTKRKRKVVINSSDSSESSSEEDGRGPAGSSARPTRPTVGGKMPRSSAAGLEAEAVQE